ncbi:MAG: hypothetical protein DSM107014_04935 [Gomphosphaeria aponina SAG 52.96 = DSM 107014]|uniref:Uncharacterized protein n=1 Tax=Gomphosphaeria aponina SAG 52.96 = DSM 107014 TaxID=1521640 RepID=A0A941GPL9_9CHRO|nr:hypothetical protein [Gomphosphaeria aponina SAG 52.96 = DSM 107014]
MEIQNPTLSVGETVEIVILVPEEQSISLAERLAFLKLPITERRRILATQAEEMSAHYEQDSQWQELMAGDIIDY